MKQQDLYARLELIPPDMQASYPSRMRREYQAWKSVKAAFGQLGYALVNYLCGSMEPRIITQPDPKGLTHYRVFDPVTHQHHTFGSETELRVWLDQRYYK